MSTPQEKRTSTPTKRRILGPCATVFTAANTGSWRLERPEVDPEKCVYCGICAQYCPVDCIRIDRKEKTIRFDWNYCKGCGICANECPKKAVELVEESEVP